MTRIKVCCIRDIGEAHTAIRLGATALGLVSEMPSGPGVIEEASIVSIASEVPSGTDTFLLTSLTDAGAIAAQHGRLATTTLQLVDQVGVSVLTELRDRLPSVRLVQVIHVRGPESLDEAIGVERHVDALLLDSGDPGLDVKKLGGTGRTHDWDVSRKIVEAVNVPVYLAGGLNSANVGDAMGAVRPYGLDLCSGVRTGGTLDPIKLAEFMASVRAAGDW
ncbi:MAG: phosphoribosylanthranilate isomerase [Gemmatimonadota bacterium]|nr:phosphoribosylanthranilate isomerase [Gemmatimonadota bacterium]